ncbi:MAG: hypothetical protein FJW23_07275 [Acidimicrobiia bacterium]|nr:hypothetical protein [Acidimicrobiia bacterium]
MSGPRPSQAKRAREKALIDKRQRKAERRQQANSQKERPNRADGLDPDIAHIVPGPQPNLVLEDELSSGDE